jgi:hypothetical protein
MSYFTSSVTVRIVGADNELLHFAVTVRIVRADNELLHFISYCAHC